MAKSTTPDLRLVLGIDLARLKKDFDAAVAMARQQGKLISDALNVTIGADADRLTKQLAQAALKARDSVRAGGSRGGGGGTTPPPSAPSSGPSPEDEGRRRQTTQERVDAALRAAAERRGRLNVEIEKKTTDAVIDEVLRLRQKRDETNDAILNETDKTAKAALAIQRRAINEELKAYSAAAKQRPEVVEDGAGVRAGFLGKKRNVDVAGAAGGAFNFNQVAQAADTIGTAFQSVIDKGTAFQAGVAELSAITGVSGDALDDLGKKARSLAIEFGGSATGNIDAFKGILSKLGPDIAKSPAALETMTRAVNTLSAATGDDAAASMEALTTGLLQFGVDLSDPVRAATEMTKQMNVMAAGAKFGAAEVPQVAEAIKVAGVAASNSKVSFEETNAAIQALAAGGKVGSEAGTALRNVMSKLGEGRFLPKDTQDELKAAGVDIAKLGDTSLTFTDRLRELNKISGDAALKTKLFGSENAAAGEILLRSTDAIDKLKTDMTGTNTAFEQAAIRQDTVAASLARFKARVEDLAIGAFGVLGDSVTTVLGATTQIAPALATFSQLKGILPTDSIIGFTKGLLGSVIPALGATTTAQATAGAAGASMWAAITGPIGLIVLAIGAVIGVFILLYKNSETFRAAIDKLVKKFTDFGDKLWKTIKPALDAIGEMFGVLIDVIGEIAGVWLDLLIMQFEAFIGVIGAVIGWVGDAVASLFGFEDAGKMIDGVFAFIGRAVQTVKNGVEGFKRALDFVKGGVTAFAAEVGGALKELFSFDFEALFNRIKTAGDRVKKGAADAVRGGVITRGNDAVRSDDLKKWEGYKAAWQKIFNESVDPKAIKKAVEVGQKFIENGLRIATTPERKAEYVKFGEELALIATTAEERLKQRPTTIPPPTTPPKTKTAKAVKDLTDEVRRVLAENLGKQQDLSLDLKIAGVSTDLSEVENELAAQITGITDRIAELGTDEFKGAKGVADLIKALEAQKLLLRQEFANRALDIIVAAGADEATRYTERYASLEAKEIEHQERRLAILKETNPQAVEAIWSDAVLLLERQQAFAVRQFIDSSEQFKTLSKGLFDSFAVDAISDSELETGLEAIRARIAKNAANIPELALLTEEQRIAMDKLLASLIETEKKGVVETRKSLNAIDTLYSASMDFRAALIAAFAKKEDAARREERRKKKEALDQEVADLKAAYIGGKIGTLDEYYDKAEELRRRQEELDAEGTTRAFEFDREIKRVGIEVTEAFEKSRNEAAQRSATTLQETEAGRNDFIEKATKDRIDKGVGAEEAAVQATAAYNDKASEEATAALANIGVAGVGSILSVLASGQDASKKFGAIIFDMVEAAIPAMVTLIFGQSIGTLGPILGPAVSGLLVGTLMGLVSLARSASGYKEGGYTGNGGVDDVAGVVHGREYVVPAGPTKRYRPILDAMRNGTLGVGPAGTLVAMPGAPAIRAGAMTPELSALSQRVAAIESGAMIPASMVRDNDLQRKYLFEIKNAVTRPSKGGGASTFSSRTRSR